MKTKYVVSIAEPSGGTSKIFENSELALSEFEKAVIALDQHNSKGSSISFSPDKNKILVNGFESHFFKVEEKHLSFSFGEKRVDLHILDHDQDQDQDQDKKI